MDFERQTKPTIMPVDQEDMKGYEVDGSIPTKYRGSAGKCSKISVPARPLTLNRAADRRDMAMLGKKQVLRVRRVNILISNFTS
jgi:hypothetical protein